MVLRETEKHENFYLKIDGRWVLIDEKILRAHPGGSAMTTYRNLDATTVFHTFHANSKSAYKMLADTIAEQRNNVEQPDIQPPKRDELISGIDDVNMGEYNLSKEQVEKICKNFDKLRLKKTFRKRTNFFKEKYSNEFQGIKRSKKGEEYETCTDCNEDISLASMEKTAIAQHQAKPKHVAAIKAKSSMPGPLHNSAQKAAERLPYDIEAIVFKLGSFFKGSTLRHVRFKEFCKLLEVREFGLLNGQTSYFARKFVEAVAIIALAVFLQARGFYVASALLMGLAWQQLGWMIHEYCHHQHFKTHVWNDIMSYVVGNFMQGFSSGGWKEQHNVHHAATNVVGRDGDLDLMPFWATVVSDLKLIDERSVLFQLISYQHLYWTLALPFLRLSWLIQSIVFVANMNSSFYDIHRKRARVEQITLAAHWVLVLAQLYFLPDFQTRLMFFLVSQLFGGFLLAHVVTYNHYSTDKFPHNDRIMENYACLQLYTTRNMRPGLFIDWLWGGLNYQIEHHLFPTMPRNNLRKVMPLVKEFCAENGLPYMVNDYLTGWKCEIEQFARVAGVARKLLRKGS